MSDEKLLAIVQESMEYGYTMACRDLCDEIRWWQKPFATGVLLRMLRLSCGPPPRVLARIAEMRAGK